jgi:hypothetical protein
MLDTRGRARVTSASMRQWRDCKGTQQRKDALVEALRISAGNKSDAAKLLGLSRQHLYRILADPSRHGLGGDGGDAGDSVTQSYMGRRDTGGDRYARVTRNSDESLTYGHPRPSLTAVSTEPAVDSVAMTLVLPRRCAEWLDLESVRRKHALGHGKPAKSPIVVDLIEREMARRDKRKKNSE